MESFSKMGDFDSVEVCYSAGGGGGSCWTCCCCCCCCPPLHFLFLVQLATLCFLVLRDIFRSLLHTWRHSILDLPFILYPVWRRTSYVPVFIFSRLCFLTGLVESWKSSCPKEFMFLFIDNNTTIPTIYGSIVARTTVHLPIVAASINSRN